LDDLADGWMKRRMNGKRGFQRKDDCVSGWMGDGWNSVNGGWKDGGGYLDGMIVGGLIGSVYEWMSRTMVKEKKCWMDRWVDGWRDACTDICVFMPCIVPSPLQLQPSQRRNPHRSQSWAS